jgi:ComF family protein
MAAPDFDFAGFAAIPTPLSKKRIRERGYNQSELIGRHLARIWKIPIISNRLIKIKDTKNQAELLQAQRLVNLKGAFVCAEKFFIEKNILLVDDVVTTGATMEECARVLAKSGAKKIIGVSFARTN